MEDQLFVDRDEALKQINQWIREGSNLESWASYSTGELVTLRGQDGSEECFYIFFTEEDRQHFLTGLLATD